MAAKHELEIEISPSGEVHVHVKGVKGKKCLNYVEIFNTLGKVKEQKVTSEYYEPEPKVGIFDQIKTHTDR
jgi:hypothetical protein